MAGPRGRGWGPYPWARSPLLPAGALLPQDLSEAPARSPCPSTRAGPGPQQAPAQPGLTRALSLRPSLGPQVTGEAQVRGLLSPSGLSQTLEPTLHLRLQNTAEVPAPCLPDRFGGWRGAPALQLRWRLQAEGRLALTQRPRASPSTLPAPLRPTRPQWGRSGWAGSRGVVEGRGDWGAPCTASPQHEREGRGTAGIL